MEKELRRMKKLRVLVVIGLLLLISGCTRGSLNINEGTYYLTPAFNWNNIDINLMSDTGLKLLSYYTDWKEQSDLVFLIDQPRIEKYGDLMLGNHQTAFEFGITKKDNYIDNVYVDGDCNGGITDEEVVKLKKGGKSSKGAYDFWYSYSDELPVYVPYLKADGTIVNKNTFLWLGFFYYDFHSKYNEIPNIVMVYKVTTHFSGEATITYKDDLKKVKFLLMDGDNNGNFNDFGTDYLLLDKNLDGKYKFSSEKQPLLELFETTVNDSGEKLKKTLRLHLFAYPEKLIITDANADAPSGEMLEPSEDDNWEDANKQRLLLLLKSFLDEKKK
jgi:hypothetical protein